MAGYLDQYGAGEERREKIVKRSMIAVGVLAVVFIFVAAPLWVYFYNHRQESRVKSFFELLAAKNYTEAYAMWCTAAQPCPGYPMASFMQDWGPSSGLPDNVAVLDGQSCGTGVIVDVDAGKAGDKRLWVERDSLTIGFAPFPECPRQNRISQFIRNIKYRIHGRKFQ